MIFIIIAILLVVGIPCLIKCFKEFEDDNTIYALISVVCATCSLTLLSISINNYYIIEAISLIVFIFCMIKTIKNWWDIGIITPLVGIAFGLFILILLIIS